MFGIFGGGDEKISTEYEYSGDLRDEKINYYFDLSDRPAGNYEIIIKVKDLVGGNEVSKKVFIKVV